MLAKPGRQQPHIRTGVTRRRQQAQAGGDRVEQEQAHRQDRQRNIGCRKQAKPEKCDRPGAEAVYDDAAQRHHKRHQQNDDRSKRGLAHAPAEFCTHGHDKQAGAHLEHADRAAVAGGGRHHGRPAAAPFGSVRAYVVKTAVHDRVSVRHGRMFIRSARLAAVIHSVRLAAHSELR